MREAAAERLKGKREKQRSGEGPLPPRPQPAGGTAGYLIVKVQPVVLLEVALDEAPVL